MALNKYTDRAPAVIHFCLIGRARGGEVSRLAGLAQVSLPVDRGIWSRPREYMCLSAMLLIARLEAQKTAMPAC